MSLSCEQEGGISSARTVVTKMRNNFPKVSRKVKYDVCDEYFKDMLYNLGIIIKIEKSLIRAQRNWCQKF